MDIGPILEQLKEERKYLYVVVVMLIVVVALYFVYRAFFSDVGSGVDAPIGTSPIALPSVTAVEQLKRDLNVIADPLFKNLRLPIELPIKLSPPGRDNPFEPF